jgi:uncharacterized protein YqjF (DUF2071 family)
MTGVRPRGLPAVPTTAAFAELNVRTYVTDGKMRGVWFFSLDAQSRLAVATARRFFHLNYQHARMSCRWDGHDVQYASSCRRPAAEFRGRYRSFGDEFHSGPGTLEEFLTERYWLYSADRAGRLYRGQIDHERWPLRRAEAEIELNTMTAPLGIELRGEPHLLFTKRVSILHKNRHVSVYSGMCRGGDSATCQAERPNETQSI